MPKTRAIPSHAAEFCSGSGCHDRFTEKTLALLSEELAIDPLMFWRLPYRLAGHEPDRDYRYVEINHDLQALYPKLVSDVMHRLNAIGTTVTRDLLLCSSTVKYSAIMVLSRCH